LRPRVNVRSLPSRVEITMTSLPRSRTRCANDVLAVARRNRAVEDLASGGQLADLAVARPP